MRKKKDTSNLDGIKNRWSFLLEKLCQNISTTDEGLVILKSAKFYGEQEGLLHLVDKNETFYFRKDKDRIVQVDQNNELKKLEEFALYLKDDFNKKIIEADAKQENVIVHDAPTLQFFFFDKSNAGRSGFYSIEYSHEIFP